ncbi:helix-turn-helix domain-containing protein [Acetobacter sicerae]|uniref:helix-turn-helix domain-containing protein n=1 Tax=Acetobacter sicerae TaxID=85325 RepID=UPI00156ADF3A|nr:helix-turn-helix transcriptional regulator [Acetobacter sicerae]NHN93764.1 helix-turn-helix domain-containing protein [Acetobacter sicerae]
MKRLYRRNDDECKRRMSDMIKNPPRHNGDMAHAKPPKSSELREAIAARFKAAFNAYGASQAELARQLEIDPRQLNGYLRGKNFPDESVIVKFCDITRCPTDWIYRGVIEAKMPLATAIHIAMESPDLFPTKAEAGVLEQAIEAAANRSSEES